MRREGSILGGGAAVKVNFGQHTSQLIQQTSHRLIRLVKCISEPVKWYIYLRRARLGKHVRSSLEEGGAEGVLLGLARLLDQQHRLPGVNDVMATRLHTYFQHA